MASKKFTASDTPSRLPARLNGGELLCSHAAITCRIVRGWGAAGADPGDARLVTVAGVTIAAAGAVRKCVSLATRFGVAE